MSKIKIEMKKDRIHSIISDYYTQDDLSKINFDESEETVDIRVFNLMESLYPNNSIVAQNKKDADVYKWLKSKNNKFATQKRGRCDITLYDYFGDNNIEIMIEDKFDKNKENPINEAITYCNNINESGKYTCRIAIGVNPFDNYQVITKILNEKNEWVNLVINGKIINGFIGQEILRIIYSNPGKTEFELIPQEEQTYSRSEFKKLLDRDLPEVFRKMSDISDDDNLKISFTVAFISLKVILEKEEYLKRDILDESNRKVLWRKNTEKADNTINSLQNINDIKAAVNAIVGETAKKELKDKFEDIFILNDKYKFNDLIDKIRISENKSNIKPDQSSVIKMKAVIDKIKNLSLYQYDFDLFGEVYESMADKDTKKVLGQFFTKRHIIKPLVRLLFKPYDFEGIINKDKKVCDPFCGTGGMLTETYKQIKSYCNDKYPSVNTSDIAKKVIYGYDIIESNVGKTKINLTLASDGYSVIEQRDSLLTLNKANEFDYIITNVPYGKGQKDSIVKNIEDTKLLNATSERDGIINRIRQFEKRNNTQKLEYNSLIKVIQILKEGGTAIVIVPDGILENPSFSNLREWLLIKCKIRIIISLPKYAFAPYTKEKTYALLLEKRETYGANMIETLNDISEEERIYCYIIDNDGYANSDKQYETPLRDNNGVPLHNELSDYYDNNGDFHNSILEQICISGKEDESKHYDEWGNLIPGKKYGHISIKEILQDYYYKDEEQKESDKVYRLNLLPEKYFRPKEFENMDYEQLIQERKNIENKLKNIIECID